MASVEKPPWTASVEEAVEARALRTARRPTPEATMVPFAQHPQRRKRIQQPGRMEQSVRVAGRPWRKMTLDPKMTRDPEMCQEHWPLLTL
jgi:hypothetical protein